jgi:exopolysaccharide biosynthesis protein
MDEELNAILAMNGDFYGNGGNGVVIRNGIVYRDSVSNLDVCVLYYDGTMKTFTPDEFNVEQAIEDGAWQAWSFGPELLNDDGASLTSFNADRHIGNTNPRSVLGYYEPGHYCYVVVDGRQFGYSAGLNITELSDLMEELGCTAAYNMDGGKSSSMTFNDATVNKPCDGGRAVSDCILIKEVE